MIRTVDWAMMPSAWILDDPGVRRFSVRRQGVAVSAMKVYLAILAATRVVPADGLNRGEAALTYEEIGSVAGVARSHVPPALKLLEGLVTTTPGTGRAPNRYQVIGFPDGTAGGWAKVPVRMLLGNNTLADFSPRRRVDLAALKLYYLFLALRSTETGEASVSYDTITQYTAVPRGGIRKAISVLINHGLVRLHSGVEWGGVGYNRYEIRGL